MKTLKTVLFYLMLALFFSSAKIDTKNTSRVLLVLENVDQKESFSMFSIKEVDGVFVGTNIDEYKVDDGVYFIKSTSNNKFYHKRIIVVS